MQATKADRLTAIALAVFKLNGQLIEWGNQFAKPHGLTSARWQMLGAIALAPQPPSMPQIGAAMGVSRQGVLKQINLLVDEGLVQALPNPLHKRSPLYVLTPRGQTAYQALSARWQAHVQGLAAAFTAAELNATAQVLTALGHAHEKAPQA
ncbi:MAG: MarR family winged helix-turn-helix transcriptional regulator [Proteobacteria bacterium]|nr:MarR family winged helix-turn-helix transcriptional regulator [Pseudomonadota bacterium]